MQSFINDKPIFFAEATLPWRIWEWRGRDISAMHLSSPSMATGLSSIYDVYQQGLSHIIYAVDRRVAVGS